MEMATGDMKTQCSRLWEYEW